MSSVIFLESESTFSQKILEKHRYQQSPRQSFIWLNPIGQNILAEHLLVEIDREKWNLPKILKLGQKPYVKAMGVFNKPDLAPWEKDQALSGNLKVPWCFDDRLRYSPTAVLPHKSTVVI
ncbi:hypothetical protein ABXV18_24740 [Vibrio owensii]|uniref:hypothetical protein n=1 Tax=Vibrio owensii TaxID=696485 RepID=UPI0033980B27